MDPVLRIARPEDLDDDDAKDQFIADAMGISLDELRASDAQARAADEETG